MDGQTDGQTDKWTDKTDKWNKNRIKKKWMDR